MQFYFQYIPEIWSTNASLTRAFTGNLYETNLAYYIAMSQRKKSDEYDIKKEYFPSNRKVPRIEVTLPLSRKALIKSLLPRSLI